MNDKGRHQVSAVWNGTSQRLRTHTYTTKVKGYYINKITGIHPHIPRYSATSLLWEFIVLVKIQVLTYTRSNNLIPGMATACRSGVESSKLMYPSTFGHVPTCIYMSHRPNESFVPKQQRKKYVSVVYCCRENLKLSFHFLFVWVWNFNSPTEGRTCAEGIWE
jgi:hypothetical protein